MERATGTEVYGCGSPQSTDITLNIQTTTGGNFSVSLNGKHTVESLKKLVSKKLKVSKDRICLLHRERQLTDGTLEENGLLDGSRIILLPSVETGLLSQRPDNTVMQALESLNDTQVNDFLSGRSPLNLTMRLGDHMMLIQLQLSTLNSASSSGSRSLRTSTPTKSTSSPLRPCCETAEASGSQTTFHRAQVNAQKDKMKQESPARILQKQDLEILQNAFDLYRSMTEEKLKCETVTSSTINEKKDTSNTTNSTISDLSAETSVENDQSPIKSLSNMVSSPIEPTTSEGRDIVNSVKNNLIDLLAKSTADGIVPASVLCDKVCPSTSSQASDSSFSDDNDNFTDQSSFLAENTIDEYPMENLFNSAVDKGLFGDQDECMLDREISNLATTSHGEASNAGALPSFQSLNEPLKTKRFQYLLHKTSKFKHPIGQNKQRAFMQSVVNKHKKRMQTRQDNNLAQPSTSRTEPYITNSRKLILQPSSTSAEDQATPSTSKQISFRPPDAPKKPVRLSPTPTPIPTPTLNTKALLEASKNLTQKLKKLSKEVLTNKIDPKTAEETMRTKIGPGAVIESMKHHGKGIYSGTFSGTLNPSLQDRYGRPKRDISTIVHILNDLLCATPPIALPQKDTSHACKNADQPKKCANCSLKVCLAGKCKGHPTTDCQCQREPCADCTDGTLCTKCENAKTLAMDNSKTKCKLEQLRLVMQQKKQRREARKLKTMPYANTASKLGSPDQTSVLKEEIETVA